MLLCLELFALAILFGFARVGREEHLEQFFLLHVHNGGVNAD
jgi:hypothetical protein